MKKTAFLLSSFIIIASFWGLNAQKVRFFKLGSHVMNLQQAQALIAQSDPQLIALFKQRAPQKPTQNAPSEKTKNTQQRPWRV
ncbi:MAG: hypothetical protein WC365_02545 [Candidatus Babeliales bacterium]